MSAISTSAIVVAGAVDASRRAIEINAGDTTAQEGMRRLHATK